ncbi:hypothetical protein [Lentzea sp. NPDC051838]|uniref:hypothetical protein n=1 Tax=Lentzea sp. NPDC051838 TaxID=3154849 RepID=UPI00343D3FA6
MLVKLNSFATWDGWTKLGVLVAVVGLLFTQQSVGVSQKQFDLAEQAQINDRFSKAAEQLASKEALMRVAAIQSLQGVATRWPEQKGAVNSILSNFVLGGLPAGSDCAEIVSPDALQALDVINLGRGDALWGFPATTLSPGYIVVYGDHKRKAQMVPVVINVAVMAAYRQRAAATVDVGFNPISYSVCQFY